MKDVMRILWWGKGDNGYSRNGVVRTLFARMGHEIVDFRPMTSGLGDWEAFFRCQPKCDLVWVPCFRQRDMLAASRYARRKGIPLVFDPLISAYEKAVDEFHRFNEATSSARHLLLQERRLFALADVIVADTEAHAEYYHAVLGVPKDKIKVVYVGAETMFSPSVDAPDREVLFYGSFLPLQGPTEIVEAAKLCQDLPLRWTLLGNGPLRKRCEELAVGCQNISFEDPVPYRELPERIRRAEILLGVFGTTEKANRVIPNKVFQALACGRPVITRAADRCYPSSMDSAAVRFVRPGSPKDIADAVRDWCENSGRLAMAAAAARNTFDEQFPDQVIEDQLEEVIGKANPDLRAVRVSVIIPVYNVERYLARCLDSVLEAARGLDVEIICINDGSTDCSSQILATYSDRVRIIEQDNRGQAAARNRGLEVAAGAYIMFVDSDDWIPPNAISRFLRVALSSGQEVVVSSRYLKDGYPKSRSMTQWRMVEHSLEGMVSDRKICSTVWNKLFSARTLRRIRFIEGIKFEDWPFLIDVFAGLKSFAVIDDPLYVYFTNNGAESTIHSAFTESKVADYLRGIKYVLCKYQGHEKAKVVLQRAGLAASMLINKSVHSGDHRVVGAMVENLGRLMREFMELRKCIRFKSRFRFWLASRKYGGGK